MPAKDVERKTVESLPDQFTIEEMVEQLVILNKIEEGHNDIE